MLCQGGLGLRVIEGFLHMKGTLVKMQHRLASLTLAGSRGLSYEFSKSSQCRLVA